LEKGPGDEAIKSCKISNIFNDQFIFHHEY
jgi:hypothetical protein